MTSKVVSMLIEGNEDISWLDKNHDCLMEQFKDNFIAVKGKMVLASNRSLEGLFRQLKRQNVDRGDVLVRFVSDMKTVLMQ